MSPVPVRYVRLLRFAWLNPSCAEAQAALHAFERENQKDVDAWVKRANTEPMLTEDEMLIVLRTIDYFGRCEKWDRLTRTEAEVREMFGVWEATS